jgi:hypothetical protein
MPPYQQPVDDPPEGIIPRIEPQPKHREFVDTVQPPYAMLKITDARRLADRGETATSYFGSVPTVITTSTVRDSDLFLLSWLDEFEILEQFEPDFHLPADQSIYKTQPQADRTELVKKSLEGFLAIRQLLEENQAAFNGSPPTLIPLLKGVTAEEQDICLQVFDDEDVQMAAFYAVQYFTNDGQPRTTELVEDLTDLANRSQPELSYLVIGGLGPTLTERYPAAVDAAAGFTAWYSRLSSVYKYEAKGSQSLPLARAHDVYHPFAAQVNDQLGASAQVSYDPEWYDVPTTSPRNQS